MAAAGASGRDDDSFIDSINAFQSEEAGGGDPHLQGAEFYQAQLDSSYTIIRNAWLYEKSCPELLPYAEEEMGRLITRIQEQEDELKHLSKEIATKKGDRGASAPSIPLALRSVHFQDLERVRFLVAAYLRVRFKKISAQFFHLYHKRDEYQLFLSPKEQELVNALYLARQAHLQHTVLDKLPEELSSLEEELWKSGPELRKHVFVTVSETCRLGEKPPAEVALPNTGDEEEEEEEGSAAGKTRRGGAAGRAASGGSSNRGYGGEDSDGEEDGLAADEEDGEGLELEEGRAYVVPWKEVRGAFYAQKVKLG